MALSVGFIRFVSSTNATQATGVLTITPVGLPPTEHASLCWSHECHMSSTAIRDRRRTLRYRHLLVRQMVQMKNRVSGLLLETGVSHNKQRLHKVGYFRDLLATNEEISEASGRC